MIAAFTTWLLSLITGLFSAVWDFVSDIFVSLLSAVLTALAALITAIPAPSFVSQYSMTTLINMLPSNVLYFIAPLQLTTAFTLLAAGFAFRMARKIFTLGQW